MVVLLGESGWSDVNELLAFRASLIIGQVFEFEFGYLVSSLRPVLRRLSCHMHAMSESKQISRAEGKRTCARVLLFFTTSVKACAVVVVLSI